jgi:hypothetical protein
VFNVSLSDKHPSLLLETSYYKEVYSLNYNRITAIINSVQWKDRIFAIVSHFHISLTFADIAESYIIGALSGHHYMVRLKTSNIRLG